MGRTLDFKIEPSFERELQQHLENEGLKVYTVQELSEKEVIEFAIFAIDWAQRIVFLLGMYHWLKDKEKEGKYPKFSVEFDGNTVTTIAEYEDKIIKRIKEN